VPQGQEPLGDIRKTQFDLIHDVAVPVPRKELFASVMCPSNAIADVKQSKYKQHLISTTLRLNGTWVASYGRPGKTKARKETDKQAVAESEPYLAAALALADAKVGIDDRGRKSQVPRGEISARSSIAENPHG
jgi:hypothetical protein